MAAKKEEEALVGIGLSLKPRKGKAEASIGTSRSDPRAAQVVAATMIQMEDERTVRAQVEDALQGAGLTVDSADVSSVVSYLGQIKRNANTARTSMLAIGEALLRIQETVGPGGYAALAEAGVVPFSESQASKFRRVALAVRAKVLAPETMPATLDAAAVAARLPQDQAADLTARGEIRPESTVRQMRELARKLEEEGRDRRLTKRERMIRRLGEIHAEVGEHRAAIRKLQEEAGDLRRQIKAMPK